MRKIITSFLLIFVIALSLNVSIASANTQIPTSQVPAINQVLGVLLSMDIISVEQYNLLKLAVTASDDNNSPENYPGYSKDAPMIKVSSPGGGEVFEFGEKIKVFWDSDNLPEDTVTISFYDGSTFYNVETDIENDGRHSIEIPKIEGEFKIMITSGGEDPVVSDESDDFFHIFREKPEIKITYKDVSSEYEDLVSEVGNGVVEVYEVTGNLIGADYVDIKTWEIDYDCNSNIEEIGNNFNVSCTGENYLEDNYNSFSHTIYVYKKNANKTVLDIYARAYDIPNPLWTIKDGILEYPISKTEFRLENPEE